MRAMRLVVWGVLWLGIWQQEKKPGEEKASEKTAGDASKLVNPSPESIAQGKKAYGFDCAMCHGKEGAGDGDLAESMHVTRSHGADCDVGDSHNQTQSASKSDPPAGPPEEMSQREPCHNAKHAEPAERPSQGRHQHL